MAEKKHLMPASASKRDGTTIGAKCDLRNVLETLSASQLRQLGRCVQVHVRSSMAKAELVKTVEESRLSLRQILANMTSEHLCAVANKMGLGIRRARKREYAQNILRSLSDRSRGRLGHMTALGRYYLGDSKSILQGRMGSDLEGQVNLNGTSIGAMSY
jgi:hypothetical protein